MSKKQGITILGIDPGYGRVGWGVVSGSGFDWNHVAHGCIETSPKKSLVARLAEIQKELDSIIDTYKPDCAGVEDLFFYRNVTTAIQVGQARGVILVSLHNAKIPIQEFTPPQVKQAVTGYGKADKKQVELMVMKLLHLAKRPTPDDAADALAVALATGTALMFLIKSKGKNT